MTEYEPVTVADLKPGDEVEVVYRGVISERGNLDGPSGTALLGGYVLPDAHTIRRKSRPIRVGDRMRCVTRGWGEVIGLDGDEAWVKFDDVTEGRQTVAFHNLTRV